MIRSGSLVWFARHEGRLAWREWLSMMTAGRRRRRWSVALGLAAFAIGAHAIAWFVVGRRTPVGAPDKATLVLVSAGALMLLPVMLSQAMESVTRAFYSRADLDLILSSPVAAARLFAVRIASMAASVTLTATLVAAPVIDVLAIRGGWRWLGGYGLVAAIGMIATALAVAFTVGLFRVIGPKRTRIVAQVVAAVIGATFVIGIQLAAILSYGTVSRVNFLTSDAVMRHAPGPGSPLWLPARAVAGGDLLALVGFVGFGVLVLWAAVLAFAPGFGTRATIAAGVTHDHARARRGREFRALSPARALRRKEWMLLLRDPWLASQSLMQLFYLVVPALLLWRSAASGLDARALIVPVLIMTAGQLAGGLAWITISGEDAPDLVASAPISEGAVLRAKVEAVMGAVAMIFCPLIAAYALASPVNAMIALAGVLVATASSTLIQLWFRTQAKRSNFRRRQTSSRLATFAEALATVIWAATGTLAAGGQWIAIILAMMALGILAAVRLISPAGIRSRQARRRR